MKISILKSAEKILSRLDAPTRRRITTAIYKLPAGDVRKLKGYVATFRLRVGDWRIIFEMTPKEIEVNNVLPRGDAYKQEG